MTADDRTRTLGQRATVLRRQHADRAGCDETVMEDEQIKARANREHRQLGELRQHLQFLERRVELLESLLTEGISNQWFDANKCSVTWFEEVKRAIASTKR
jgi:hypothetical protein